MADVLDLALGALTARRCGELYAAVAAAGGAVGTQHEYLKKAKTWGASAVERGWFKANPWESVKKVGERDDSRDVSLRVDEARKFRSKALALATAGDEGALSVLIILSCSLRPSEVVQLEARDVDDSGAVLWVAGARLKTKNTRRPIRIDDAELRALLLARAKAVGGGDTRLFSIDRNEVTQAAKAIATAAKVPVVDSRALRRTFATLDARRGSSLDALAFNMGHGSDGKARTAKQRSSRAPSSRARRVACSACSTAARRRRRPLARSSPPFRPFRIPPQ